MIAAVISDTLSSEVAPRVCNAAMNATGKLLDTVQMQYTYGTLDEETGTLKELVLCGPNAEVSGRAVRLARLEKELEALKNEPPATETRP